MYKEIEGNLITLALEGKFDVIIQGNNCFCVQGAGLAPQMVKAFETDQFPLENRIHRGDINKLGCIDFAGYKLSPLLKTDKNVAIWVDNFEATDLWVVNCYTQYGFGQNHPDGIKAPVDYEAITICLRKLNQRFIHRHIGIPQIGAGLAGGDWNRIKNIIQTELTNCDVTVVIYDGK